jgi:1-deoxy-D-xylulose-5-phosphate synthase
MGSPHRLRGMGHLESITSPRDLRDLSDDQLDALAAEIRDLMIRTVATNSGHLGPNLGVVEVTLAIHRVFDSPRDRVVFDTGHQSYVHKLVTGRREAFGTLRKEGGVSGYPSQAESEHDIVENSHASTALSYADGLAKAYAIRGEDRHVVAVIGDGALTGGMAWEALNNIAINPQSRLVIVVNDNGRSYTPTIGGLATALTTLRTDPQYERVLEVVKRRLNAVPGIGHAAYDALHAVKKGMKDALAPQGLFEDLGLKYVGPIDGHDRTAMEGALTRAKRFGGPVIVHAITRKGFGYDPAERHEADQFHAPGPFDVQTGAEKPKGLIWTDHFAEHIVQIGARRPDIVAITAAMMHPVGLDKFQARFPERTFDVGIAEQHAATSAAGLAIGGLHPVVAVYATFLNRAFDQVLMDVALHKAGVTFVLDRAGITGDDGASHNGMWDMAMLRIVPGLRLAAPRDETTLRAALRAAVDVDDAPTVVRYPKGAVGEDIPAVEELDGVDIVGRFEAKVSTGSTSGMGSTSGKGSTSWVTRRVLVVGVGSMAGCAMETGEALAAHGVEATVASPTWVLPVPENLVKLCGEHDLVVTVEDGVVDGGIGEMLAQRAGEQGIGTPQVHMGLPVQFLDHASRDHIVRAQRMTAADATRDALAALALL